MTFISLFYQLYQPMYESCMHRHMQTSDLSTDFQLRAPLTMNSLNFCKRFFTCSPCASDIYYIERFMALFRPMLQFCVKLGRRRLNPASGVRWVLDNASRNFFLHRQLAFLLPRCLFISEYDLNLG